MTHRHAIRRLRSNHLYSAIATAMLLTTPGHAAASADTTQQEQMRSFDIAAQPLATALIAFGQQAGVQISVSSQLLKGKQAGAVQGELSLEQALQRLLAGTGLTWRQQGGGTLTLEPAPRIAENQAEQRPLRFADVVVMADRERKQGESTIDRRTIEALPAGNGDITSLLKIHPNVQFDNSQLSSKTPGEISPANISINGAKFYQNAFLVDGMNMNNDINPGDSQHNLADGVPGRSQGLALDTDLLDEIHVLDSNVGAQYGGFNGGVVEARTRKPTRELHGKVSTQIARSEWTEYHVDEDERDNFEGAGSGTDYASSYQPEFSKRTYRATLEGHLTDDFGLLASFVQKESTIPVHLYSPNNIGKSGYKAETRDEERKAQNFFLKAVWTPSERLDLEGSLTYAPEASTHYRNNALDSGYSVDSGGLMFNSKALYQGDFARFTQNLSLSRMENSRDSDRDDWHNWRMSADKNWGVGTLSTEGGYGDIEQRQDAFDYKLVADWNELNLIGSRHLLQTGFEFRHQKYDYERLTDSTVNAYSLLGSRTCASMPGQGLCHEDLGQYVGTLTRYDQGEVNFSLNSWAFFLQDEIHLGNLMLRPGLRLDSDDYMDKSTLAPRLALEWDLFGDRSTRFSAGINRYYGRNAASWRLQQGRSALQHTYLRNAGNGFNWVERPQGSDTQFAELDIPYDDELTFGVTQQVRDLELGLKWVRREGRDQVMEVERADGSYAYTNDGKSNTEVLTLTLTPLRSFDLWGARNSGQLAADWTHHNTNHNSYAESIEEDRYVYYRGNVIHISQLPPINYTRDWTYRLTTVTDIPAWRLSWANFFRYRAGADTLKRASQSVNGYRAYYDKSYGNAFSWDLRLAWELPTLDDQAMFVNLDVYNVTNRSNASDNSNISAFYTSAVYETGRQFMVEVGYRF
ncbi:TonB-dependent receptor [Stutzerimonas nitrititolerans]|uniref:TonB-dependent receptor n=1 Tax=Stutzerimonas nitrititolerans TaxID=2482751 RepID=UPI0028ADABD7|nr:TonB-dependent receptor [Stutzerimonas nitrititolerans]